MAHPNPSAAAGKPVKPYPDYPLTPRADGRWMKRVHGKLVYFTGTAEEALGKYEAHLAGSGQETAPDPQIRDLCEQFVCNKEAKLQSGQLARGTFDAYRKTCDAIYHHFGRLRTLASLTRQDAESLRLRLCQDVGIKTQQGRINRARIVFKWGHDHELLPRTFHEWLEPIGKRTLKTYQSKRPRRSMTAEEIHKLIDAADVPLRAMILLGVNCGFGNSDCADLTLPWLDLDGGWHDFPRPKTGETRRGKLWPETVEAIRLAISQRPEPAETAWAERVFLTRKGTPWVSPDRRRDVMSYKFVCLATKVGVQRPGVSFYTLRHVFETISGDACDQVATNLVMGHADGTMAANYRHGIADTRLEALSNHLHRWLYGKPMGKGGKRLRVVG